MQTPTDKALYEAREKWLHNADCVDIKEAKVGYLTCPLCDLFYGKDCVGCPIMNFTGEPLCRGTTYLEAWKAKEAVVRGEAPISTFHRPAKEYADLLDKLWRDG